MTKPGHSLVSWLQLQEPSLTNAAFSGEDSLGSVCSARLVRAEL